MQNPWLVQGLRVVRVKFFGGGENRISRNGNLRFTKRARKVGGAGSQK